MTDRDIGTVVALALLAVIAVVVVVGRIQGWMKPTKREDWTDSDFDHWQW